MLYRDLDSGVINANKAIKCPRWDVRGALPEEVTSRFRFYEDVLKRRVGSRGYLDGGQGNRHFWYLLDKQSQRSELYHHRLTVFIWRRQWVSNSRPRGQLGAATSFDVAHKNKWIAASCFLLKIDSFFVFLASWILQVCFINLKRLPESLIANVWL